METQVQKDGHAYVMLANGFEELEALTPVDFLRRAGCGVSTVAVNDSNDLLVEGSHGISVQADCALLDIAGTIAEEDQSIIVLPGGMPGAVNLARNTLLQTLLVQHHEETRTIAAICAAPSEVLAPLGLLQGRRFTCYPTAKDKVVDGVFVDQALVEDGNVISSQGVATAPLFAKSLVKLLSNDEITTGIWQHMLFET